MSEISEKTSGFVRDLGEAARQNPLSAALIGMGVLWLFTGSRTAERAGEFVRDSGFDRIPDAANDAFRSRPFDFQLWRRCNRRARHVGKGRAARRKRGRFSIVQTASGATMPTPRPNMSTPCRGQGRCLRPSVPTWPMSSGRSHWLWARSGSRSAPGSLQHCRRASWKPTYLGETSDNVKAKAADFAAEQTSRATTVAEGVLSAVTEEARRQGLTVENAKSAVGDISAKVGRVADAAGKGISERMQPKDERKPPAPKAKDQSHPAKHIEETARLASSVETAKDPGKVRNTKD